MNKDRANLKYLSQIYMLLMIVILVSILMIKIMEVL